MRSFFLFLSVVGLMVIQSVPGRATAWTQKDEEEWQDLENLMSSAQKEKLFDLTDEKERERFEGGVINYLYDAPKPKVFSKKEAVQTISGLNDCSLKASLVTRGFLEHGLRSSYDSEEKDAYPLTLKQNSRFTEKEVTYQQAVDTYLKQAYQAQKWFDDYTGKYQKIPTVIEMMFLSYRMNTEVLWNDLQRAAADLIHCFKAAAEKPTPPQKEDQTFFEDLFYGASFGSQLPGLKDHLKRFSPRPTGDLKKSGFSKIKNSNDFENYDSFYKEILNNSNSSSSGTPPDSDGMPENKKQKLVKKGKKHKKIGGKGGNFGGPDDSGFYNWKSPSTGSSSSSSFSNLDRKITQGPHGTSIVYGSFSPSSSYGTPIDYSHLSPSSSFSRGSSFGSSSASSFGTSLYLGPKASGFIKHLVLLSASIQNVQLLEQAFNQKLLSEKDLEPITEEVFVNWFFDQQRNFSKDMKGAIQVLKNCGTLAVFGGGGSSCSSTPSAKPHLSTTSFISSYNNSNAFTTSTSYEGSGGGGNSHEDDDAVKLVNQMEKDEALARQLQKQLQEEGDSQTQSAEKESKNQLDADGEFARQLQKQFQEEEDSQTQSAEKESKNQLDPDEEFARQLQKQFQKEDRKSVSQEEEDRKKALETAERERQKQREEQEALRKQREEQETLRKYQEEEDAKQAKALQTAQDQKTIEKIIQGYLNGLIGENKKYYVQWTTCVAAKNQVAIQKHLMEQPHLGPRLFERFYKALPDLELRAIVDHIIAMDEKREKEKREAETKAQEEAKKGAGSFTSGFRLHELGETWLDDAVGSAFGSYKGREKGTLNQTLQNFPSKNDIRVFLLGHPGLVDHLQSELKLILEKKSEATSGNKTISHPKASLSSQFTNSMYRADMVSLIVESIARIYLIDD